MAVSDRLLRWGPVVVWAAIIFTFSSIPSLGTGLGTWDLVLRKLAHLAVYGVFGVLLFRALPSVRLAVAIGSLYAVTDEIHQAFVPGRSGSALDWAIDTAGVAVGAIVSARGTR